MGALVETHRHNGCNILQAAGPLDGLPLEDVLYPGVRLVS